jgi:DNA-directed RNA polymerase subunit RPC12/RpoP
MERLQQKVLNAPQTFSCHNCGKDFSTLFRENHTRCDECFNRIKLETFVKQESFVFVQLVMFWTHIINGEEFHSYDYVDYFDTDGDVDRAIEHKYEDYDCDCSDMYSTRKCKRCREHQEHEDYIPDYGIDALFGNYQDQASDAFNVVFQLAPEMKRIFDLCGFNSQDEFLNFFEDKI